jgi:hypothetical protein
MFFGIFIIFLLFITAVLLTLLVTSGKKIFGEMIAVIWGTVIVLAVVSGINSSLTADKILEKNNYYGQYVINRNYFSGKQADWQYNSFRFEIKDNDSIYFCVTDKQKITQVFKGTISTVKPSVSERLVLHMEPPAHHILADNPTTYRNARGFYLVFNSVKFGNVFFKKGEWKPLED